MSAEVTAEFPRVRVVILSFDGGDMTIDCIESLLCTEWPADRLEILMVECGTNYGEGHRSCSLSVARSIAEEWSARLSWPPGPAGPTAPARRKVYRELVTAQLQPSLNHTRSVTSTDESAGAGVCRRIEARISFATLRACHSHR